MARRDRRRTDEPPPLPGESPKRGMRPIVILLAVVGGLTIAGLATVGFLIEFGVLQDSALRRGDDVPERTIEALREVFLEDGEAVEWYYSLAVADPREDGNVLTDKRVVSWFREDDEIFRSWVWLEDVVAIRVKFAGNWLEDSELWVWQHEWHDEEDDLWGGGPNDSTYLLVSAFENTDHEFIEDLVEAARRKGAEIVAIEIGGDFDADELDRIDGATEFTGDDWDESPAGVLKVEER